MACSRRRRRRREDGAVEPEVATGPRLGSRRFFKIVLSDTLESGKLGIPKSFLRRCGKDLSNSVLLKVPGRFNLDYRARKVQQWHGFVVERMAGIYGALLH
ncbi:hypothetical protein NL676_038963 [Syzygium grande]|nr:hypothetical protein NL676_038963 [Syzygium grande]